MRRRSSTRTGTAALLLGCRPRVPWELLEEALADRRKRTAEGRGRGRPVVCVQGLGAAFEKKTGKKVMFSFGATGLLEKQIAEGAPFDVFAAADVSFVDDAVEVRRLPRRLEGALRDAAALSSVPRRSGLPRGRSATSRTPRHREDRDREPRPCAVRQGRRAGPGARRGVGRRRSKLVYGENVQQALEFAQSGNADVAIVALSLVTVTPASARVDPDFAPRPDRAGAGRVHEREAGRAGGSEVRRVRPVPEGRASCGFGSSCPAVDGFPAGPEVSWSSRRSSSRSRSPRSRRSSPRSLGIGMAALLANVRFPGRDLSMWS